MALIGDSLPDAAVPVVWVFAFLLIMLRDLLARLPVVGGLVRALYAPPSDPAAASDPAAYRSTQLQLEKKLSAKMSVNITHQYIEVRPGIFLHCATAGSPSKPMLLLLHGFPEFWYTWRHVIEAFADSHYVVAPDQRGYNISSKPSDYTQYSLQELVDDIEMLVKKLSGGRPITLAAHDWGAAVAWNVAHCCDFVEKLVILNMPHPSLFGKAIRESAEQRRRSLYMLYFNMPKMADAVLSANGGKAVGKLIGNDLKNAEAEAEFDRDAFARAASHPGAMTGALNWYRCAFGGAKRKWKRKQIEVPVLFVYGLDDVAFDRHYVTKESLQKYAANLTFATLDKCSHWTANDRPLEVIKLVREFIEEEQD